MSAALAELPGWTGTTDGIQRTVQFTSFRTAVEALGMMADCAEAVNHHPDVDVRFRTLHIFLVTHSAGAVTERDLQLAREIDEVVGEFEEAAAEAAAAPPNAALQAALDQIDRQFRR